MKRTAPAGRQRGVAVLTAVLVVTLATVLAVNLLWQSSVDLRRTETLLLQDQARQYNLGGEELARVFLAKDHRNDPNGMDTTKEIWATPLKRDFEGGFFEGWLLDQQGRFDLNSLIGADGKVEEKASRQFVRMLTLLPLESPLDASTATSLMEATADWIDPDSVPLLNGAEDDRYTSRTPPYRPANFWFVSVSELQAVEGYTPEIYAALEPHITALPPPGKERRRINVNTATDVVLASLVDNETLESVEPLVNQEYQEVTDFITESGFAALTENDIDVKSNWFLLSVTTSIGTTQSTLYSLLERHGENVAVRLRSFDVK
ncbi:MAG: type II secretion system minor pseudopilin GspK [Gammaproteobacteria bacterium]